MILCWFVNNGFWFVSDVAKSLKNKALEVRLLYQ
jgi:hypothetical protein